MSVVGEIALVAGVAGCVAACISAYHDGDGILHRIKVKRAARRSSQQPPDSLVRSITNAPLDIEAERRRGVDRFGPAFERGDYVAIFAIQDITIQLQGSLLKGLREAAENDTIADFRGLEDAADTGRDGTIAVLAALQQRLLQAAAINEMSTLRLDSDLAQASSTRNSAQSYPLNAPPDCQLPNWEQSNALRQTITSTGGNRSSKGSGQQFAFSQSRSQAPSTTNRRDSGRYRPQPGPQRVFTLPAEQTNPLVSAERLSPGNMERTTSNTSNSAVMQTPDFHYEEWEDDPAQIWGSNRLSTYHPSTSPVPARSLSESSEPAVDTPMRGSSINSQSSSMRAMSTASKSSSTPSGASPPSRTLTATTIFSTIPVPDPSPENDYLGFCKGAWRLQNNDKKKAFREAADWASRSAHSSSSYTICRTCQFVCHSPQPWTTIFTYAELGIKLRWPFLAKSHVQQKKLLDRQEAKNYMFCYKCLFCVFEGLQEPVIHGFKSYLMHIRDVHHGSQMSDVVLYKTHCVSGRPAEREENFDINLFPLRAVNAVEKE